MKRVFAAAVALALGACAGEPRPSLDDLSSDLRVDSLPSRARVAVGGQDQGPTPATIHIDRAQVYDIAVSEVGFETRHFGGPGEALLNNRSVDLVLVPQGFNGQPPRPDDGAGLTQVAEALERHKDWPHAAEFWRQVITLMPRNPRAHRGLGSALAKLGQDEAAVREYEQYIFLDPDAPDAARVQKAIDAFRGGIDLPGVEQ